MRSERLKSARSSRQAELDKLTAANAEGNDTTSRSRSAARRYVTKAESDKLVSRLKSYEDKKQMRLAELQSSVEEEMASKAKAKQISEEDVREFLKRFAIAEYFSARL